MHLCASSFKPKLFSQKSLCINFQIKIRATPFKNVERGKLEKMGEGVSDFKIEGKGSVAANPVAKCASITGDP